MIDNKNGFSLLKNIFFSHIFGFLLFHVEIIKILLAVRGEKKIGQARMNEIRYRDR